MRAADAEVLFELTGWARDGAVRRVASGYRPQYDIQPDYQTSVEHRFVEVAGVSTGEQARAEVWFLTPEIYPGSLCVGRRFQVAEGSRVIGVATVLRVLNPLMPGHARQP